MNDLFDPEEERAVRISRADRRELDHQRDKASKRRRSSLIATLISVVIIGALFAGAWKLATNFFSDLGKEEQTTEQITDFSGTGTEPVDITVSPGDTGSAIAQTLYSSGVIASTSAFVNATYTNPSADKIQPGTYLLYKELPAASALSMLLDLENLSGNRVQINPGQNVSQITQTIKAITGLSEDQIAQAFEDTETTALPTEAAGSYEGWLADGDYRFAPEVSASEVIAEMVTRTTKRLTDLDVPRAQWAETLNVASIVEKEAGQDEEMPLVASVIYNRLEVGQRLQMDSTVHYVHGGSATAATSSDQRAEENEWNTYRLAGLPKTPIASPSLVAVNAAVNPEDTDYFYFVTINPLTKETLFAATFAEHEANVELYREWLRENAES